MNTFGWLRRDTGLQNISTETILIIIVMFLVGTLGLTIILANDPDWARWHISYLGEGNKSSAHFFNISMWVAALLVLWLSISFRRDLDLLKSSNKTRFAGMKPEVVQLGLVVMAICVYLVGLFPRSFGILPHDIFGHVIYFAFLGLCIASPWILPGLSRWFYVVSYAFHGAMMLLFISYWTGVNDSLYIAEVATFAFFLGWLSMLVRESRIGTKTSKNTTAV